MTKTIFHQSLRKEFGDNATVNTTLCGRIGRYIKGGYMNVAVGKEKVNCKLCLKKKKKLEGKG